MPELSGVVNHKYMEEYLLQGINQHFREEVGEQLIKEAVEEFSEKIREIVEAELKTYINISIESLRNMAEASQDYHIIFHKREQ